MKIDRIIADADRPLFSFEFYPPKSDAGERVLGLALESLRQLDPDFVSVTYGAGGSTRTRTLELTKWIKQELGIEAMAHLSCVGATKRRAADDPGRHERGRDRERAGAPRRSAARRDRVARRTPAG